jgi:hypothetical protein
MSGEAAAVCSRFAVSWDHNGIGRFLDRANQILDRNSPIRVGTVRFRDRSRQIRVGTVRFRDRNSPVRDSTY